MVMVEIRVPYRVYPRVQVEFKEASHTQQHFKDDTDINIILKRNPDITQCQYVNHRGQPTYGDFSDVADYRDALDRVLEAQEQFDELPSGVRERFGNDPGQFLEFVLNPENKDEMVKMGLTVSKPVELAQNEPTSPIGETSA